MNQDDVQQNTPHNPGPSEKEPKLQQLNTPTSSEIREALTGLDLTEDSTAVLEFVVKDTLADLGSYQRARARKISQDERLPNLINDLETRLAKLILFLESHPGILKEVLPVPTAEKLGELYSFTGLGKALERDAFPEVGKSPLGRSPEESISFDIASAETFYARQRKDQGLVHTDRLFLYPLRIVHEWLNGWIVAKAANRGGRPAKAERRFMIERLAEAAPDILGSEPPISVTSRFVDLCERVLPLCGFSEDGIDKAVVSVLTRMRKRGAQGAESIKK